MMNAPSVDQNINVTIGERFSGQVALGNNNFQVRSMHGGVINHFSGNVQRRAYPAPVILRPGAVSLFLDRQQESETARRVLERGDTVQLYGEPGIGKTWLLRRLGNDLSDFADGILYFRGRRQPLEDILQQIYESFYFYDGHVPIKPTPAMVRQALQEKEALILIDDLDLPREEVEELVGTLPYSSFLLVASERRFWGEGRALGLKGLPTPDAVALLAAKLDRPIADANKQVAAQICSALDGSPLRIFQAASTMKDDDISLADYWQRIRPTPKEPIVEQLTELEEAVLGHLTAVDAPLTEKHLQELTGAENLDDTLTGLARKGWLDLLDSRYYRLAPQQQVLMHLGDLGGGPVSLGRLMARTRRRDTAVLLQQLAESGRVEVSGSGAQQQIRLAPAQRLLDQLWQQGGGPADITQISASADVSDPGPILAQLRQDGQIVDSSGLNQVALSSPQRVLAQMAELGGGPFNTRQLNSHLNLSDPAPYLADLHQKGWIEVVTQYRLLGSGAALIGQRVDLAALREQALDYFATRAETGLENPHGLTLDVEPIQSLLDWTMTQERWADVLRLVRHTDAALTVNKEWYAWEKMLQQGLEAAIKSGDESAQAWARHQLGSRARCLGDRSKALTELIKALRLRRSLGETEAAQITLHNLLPLLLFDRGREGRSGSAANAVLADVIEGILLALATVAAIALLWVGGNSIINQFTPPSTSTPADIGTGEGPIASNPSPSHTPTPSATATATNTATPTATLTPSPTFTPSMTPTFTPTPCFPSPPATWVQTLIQPGDTLNSLAGKHNTSAAQIQQANCLADSNIQAGQPLWLPFLPPTPTPTPFLSVSGLRQGGDVVFQPESIIVPIAVQVDNVGGSDASLDRLAVSYGSNGQTESVPDSSLPTGVSLPPGGGEPLNLNVFVDPSFAGQTITVQVEGDNSSSLPLYLLPPQPVVRITYGRSAEGGAPLTYYDERQGNWQTTVTLTGSLENEAAYQNIAWTWQADGTTYNGKTMSHTFTSTAECIPYTVTLSLTASYNGYDTIGNASVSAQCN